MNCLHIFTVLRTKPPPLDEFFLIRFWQRGRKVIKIVNKLLTHGWDFTSLKLAMAFYLVWKTQLTQGNGEQKKKRLKPAASVAVWSVTWSHQKLSKINRKPFQSSNGWARTPRGTVFKWCNTSLFGNVVTNSQIYYTHVSVAQVVLYFARGIQTVFHQWKLHEGFYKTADLFLAGDFLRSLSYLR